MKSKNDSLLDNLYLAAPCSISWDSMTGDESKRSCNGCGNTVFNISDMSRKEAESFLRANGTNECMKFYRRADGTIMTDECPRALRKLRDQCKLAMKVAAGLIAFAVSFPSAFAQSVQSGDTTPIQNNLNKIKAPNPVPRPALPGGMVLRMPVQPTVKDTAVPVKHDPTTQISTDVRIITKERTLPNGKKVLLVTPDKDGKVVRVKPSDTIDLLKNSNKFIDRRAAEFFTMAQKAEANRNFELAEFYFEKTLEMLDQQKSQELDFRKRVEADLRVLRAHNANSCEGSTKKETRTNPVGPESKDADGKLLLTY